MTAEVHELVDQIHAGGDAHEQPADIRREHRAENEGGRNRHQREHHQRVRRKHGDAPVLVVAEAHFVVAEELMMIERVPLIDRAQAFDVHRPVHDVFVHRPLEDVGEDEGQRNGEPFQPRHVMDVRDVDVEHRRPHRVDQRDVKVAVVPADDAGAVFVAEVDLALRDHRDPPCAAAFAGAAQCLLAATLTYRRARANAPELPIPGCYSRCRVYSLVGGGPHMSFGGASQTFGTCG